MARREDSGGERGVAGGSAGACVRMRRLRVAIPLVQNPAEAVPERGLVLLEDVLPELVDHDHDRQ